MEHSSGELLLRFSGVTFHRSLGMPPRIRTSHDRSDFPLYLLVMWIPVPRICLLAVPFEFPSADEIFYLILQVKASHGRMPGRIMEQAELVLVLLWHLAFQRCRGSKVNFAPRVDENLIDGGSKLLVFVVPRSARANCTGPRRWTGITRSLLVTRLSAVARLSLDWPLLFSAIPFGVAAGGFRGAGLLRSRRFRVDAVPSTTQEISVCSRRFFADREGEGSVFAYRKTRCQK